MDKKNSKTPKEHKNETDLKIKGNHQSVRTVTSKKSKTKRHLPETSETECDTPNKISKKTNKNKKEKVNLNVQNKTCTPTSRTVKGPCNNKSKQNAAREDLFVSESQIASSPSKIKTEKKSDKAKSDKAGSASKISKPSDYSKTGDSVCDARPGESLTLSDLLKTDPTDAETRLTGLSCQGSVVPSGCKNRKNSKSTSSNKESNRFKKKGSDILSDSKTCKLNQKWKQTKKTKSVTKSNKNSGSNSARDRKLADHVTDTKTEKLVKRKIDSDDGDRKKNKIPKIIGSGSGDRGQVTTPPRVPMVTAKRRSKGSTSLLQDPRLETHACVLWSSENRRYFQQRYATAGSGDVESEMQRAWTGLGKKERLRFYQRANNALNDLNKHPSNKPKSCQGQAAEMKRTGPGEVSKNETLDQEIQGFCLLPRSRKEQLIWEELVTFQKCMSGSNYRRFVMDVLRNFRSSLNELRQKHKGKPEKEWQAEMESTFHRLIYSKILQEAPHIEKEFEHRIHMQLQREMQHYDQLVRNLVDGNQVDFIPGHKSRELSLVLDDLLTIESTKDILRPGPNRKQDGSLAYPPVSWSRHPRHTSWDHPWTGQSPADITRLPPFFWSDMFHEFQFPGERVLVPGLTNSKLAYDILLESGRMSSLPAFSVEEIEEFFETAAWGESAPSESHGPTEVRGWLHKAMSGACYRLDRGIEPCCNLGVPSCVLSDCLVMDKLKEADELRLWSGVDRTIRHRTIFAAERENTQRLNRVRRLSASQTGPPKNRSLHNIKLTNSTNTPSSVVTINHADRPVIPAAGDLFNKAPRQITVMVKTADRQAPPVGAVVTLSHDTAQKAALSRDTTLKATLLHDATQKVTLSHATAQKVTLSHDTTQKSSNVFGKPGSSILSGVKIVDSCNKTSVAVK